MKDISELSVQLDKYAEYTSKVFQEYLTTYTSIESENGIEAAENNRSTIQDITLTEVVKMLDMLKASKDVYKEATCEQIYKLAVKVIRLKDDNIKLVRCLNMLNEQNNLLRNYLDHAYEILKEQDDIINGYQAVIKDNVDVISAHYGIIFSKKEGQDNPNFKGMTDEMLRQLWEVCEGNINKIKKELKNVYGLSYSWQAIDKRARNIGLK